CQCVAEVETGMCNGLLVPELLKNFICLAIVLVGVRMVISAMINVRNIVTEPRIPHLVVVFLEPLFSHTSNIKRLRVTVGVEQHSNESKPEAGCLLKIAGLLECGYH